MPMLLPKESACAKCTPPALACCTELADAAGSSRTGRAAAPQIMRTRLPGTAGSVQAGVRSWGAGVKQTRMHFGGS